MAPNQCKCHFICKVVLHFLLVGIGGLRNISVAKQGKWKVRNMSMQDDAFRWLSHHCLAVYLLLKITLFHHCLVVEPQHHLSVHFRSIKFYFYMNIILNDLSLKSNKESFSKFSNSVPFFTVAVVGFSFSSSFLSFLLLSLLLFYLFLYFLFIFLSIIMLMNICGPLLLWIFRVSVAMGTRTASVSSRKSILVWLLDSKCIDILFGASFKLFNLLCHSNLVVNSYS